MTNAITILLFWWVIAIKNTFVEMYEVIVDGWNKQGLLVIVPIGFFSVIIFYVLIFAGAGTIMAFMWVKEKIISVKPVWLRFVLFPVISLFALVCLNLFLYFVLGTVDPYTASYTE